MADSPRYSLVRIVGTGCAETLLCTELRLPRPGAAIQESRKTVLIDRLDCTLGNLLVQGRLRVSVTFPVLETGAPLPPPGAPPGCTGVVAMTAGPLWCLTADIAFVLRITVAEARPAMTCRVVEAHVTASVLEVAEMDGQGAIRAVTDKSVVRVSVELLQEEAVTELGATVIPAPRSVQPSVALGRFAANTKAPRPD